MPRIEGGSAIRLLCVASVLCCVLPSAGHAQQNGKIVYLGIGGTTQEALRKAYFEPFQKETGIQVVEDPGLGSDGVQAEVQSGHPAMDVTNISTAAYETL